MIEWLIVLRWLVRKCRGRKIVKKRSKKDENERKKKDKHTHTQTRACTKTENQYTTTAHTTTTHKQTPLLHKNAIIACRWSTRIL